MKIIEKKENTVINELTIEKGVHTFDLKKSAHLYNESGNCLGFIPTYIPNGFIKIECDECAKVVRVSIYSNHMFITLIDYRTVEIIEIG